VFGPGELATLLRWQKGRHTKVKEYLTQDIKYNNSRRPPYFIQVIERSANYNEEYEEPEESVNLDISPAEFVDGYECDRASCYCSYGDDNQALPDIVCDHGVDLSGWRVLAVPDRGDDLWGIHSEAVERQIDAKPAEGGCNERSKVAVVPEVLFKVFPGWGWWRGDFFCSF